MIAREIFKANDIRGVATGADVQWDTAGAAAIGSALVEVWELTGQTLVVAQDMRTTGPVMAAAFADGVRAAGANVIDIGLASTDGLWFASGHLDLPGAMFTASHNPGNYNGIKFCHASARPVVAAELVAIADRAMAADDGTAPFTPAERPGERTEQDLLPAYADHLLGLVDLTGIRRLRVVADAGNGMAGHTLPKVLGERSEIDLVGLFTDLDGTFPNHAPNPLEPENLVDAQAAVIEHRADLALVFDGDADRCFIIDETGAVVSPSAVTAMIASQELAREPGATIVINKITSQAVPATVAAHGGTTVITRVGHTFVKKAMAEHNAIFGGEHSAHYYFRNFWGADTGMLAALHVLALVGRSDRPLSQLAAEFKQFVESGEINTLVADQDAVMDRVAEAFAGRGEQDRMDGLTVSGDGWWVNVRASNTEPLLRLNVEAREQAQMVALRDEALALIRTAG